MDEKLSRRFTTLGFIMTCIIVIFHCGNGNLEPINGLDRKINDGVLMLSVNAAIMAMQYFFIVSGYLFFWNYNNKQYFSKIKKRFFSLIIPYVIWELIFGFDMIIQGGRRAFLKSTFLFEAWPVNGPLWYLYAVFFLMLLSPAIYLMLRNDKIGFVCVVLWFVVVRMVLHTENETIYPVVHYGYLYNLIGFTPAYIVGAYLGMHEKDEDKHGDKVNFAMLFIFVYLIVSVFNYADIDFLNSFLGVLLSVLAIYFWPESLDLSGYNVTGVSFLFYAIHDAVDGKITPIIREYLSYICNWASVANIFGRVLSLLVVALFSVVIWILFSKICPRVLNIATGNRVRKYKA